jgi:hypothetical protein
MMNSKILLLVFLYTSLLVLFSCGDINESTLGAGQEPTIKITGANPDTITVGDSYDDLGATATDEEDGDLTDDIEVENEVNTSKAGSYEVLYSVTDSDNNTVTKSRTVVVLAAGSLGLNEKPVVTVVGKNPDTLMVGESYADSGATAQDEEDGDLTADIQTSGTVDTAVAGEYEIEYTVEDSEGELGQATRIVRVLDKYDTLDIKPTAGSVIEKLAYVFRIKSSHTVSGDLTLAQGETLVLGGKLTIKNGTLTIEKGARIFLAEGAYIDIYDGANILVQGTEEDSVHFKPFEKGKYWGANLYGGIYIASGAATDNTIQYAVMDSAITAVRCEREDGLAVANSTFKRSKKQGLELGKNALTSATGNAFSDNKLYSIYSDASNIGNMGEDNNLDKGIAVEGNVQSSVTWPGLKYVILGNVDIGEYEVSAGEILTIAPGAELLFKEDAYFEVQYGMSLQALGTAENPIVFKTADAGKYWGFGSSNTYSGGIWIDDEAGTDNIFDFVVMDSANTAIYAERENGLIVTNSSFTNNQYQGLILKENVLKSLDSCTFMGNRLYDLYTHASNIGGMSAQQTQEKGFAIMASTISKNATWPALKYMILETISAGEYEESKDQVLTISAGAELLFKENSYIEVQYEMSIQALGSAEKPIVFKSGEAGKYWGFGSSSTYSGGIWIDDEAGTANILDHVHFDSANTAVYSERENGLTVTNSRFTNCKFQGLQLKRNALTTMDQNEFTGNLLYDVYTHATNIGGMSAQQTQDKGFAIFSSTIAYTTTWPALEFIVLDRINMGSSDSPANQVFTIEAGAEFLFMEGAYFELDNSMSLQVQGTAENRVMFATAEIGKNWGFGSSATYSGGIWINNGAAHSHSIEYATIDMANTGIYFDAGALTVTNSNFSNYKYYAINMARGALTQSGNNYSGASTAIGNILE